MQGLLVKEVSKEQILFIVPWFLLFLYSN